MSEKKTLDFLVLPVWLTDKLHLYSGPWRDIFSTIYNYSKDGKHTYRSPMDELAKIGHISERHAITIVNSLIEAGYITREQKKVISKGESGHAKYEYKANISELLERLEAGEDIWPVSSKKGEKSSPIIEGEKGEESSSKRVNLFHKKGEKSSPQYKEYKRNKDKDILSDACAQEEREFFYIFFFRNAGNPADEVRRFAGYYQSKGWQDKDGRKYDTPEKRMGLAYGWDCKSGLRLSDTDDTKRFYNFLHSLFDIAGERGGIDPRLILDVRGGYRYHDGQLTWDCTDTVRKWFESLGYDMIRGLLDKNFCVGCKLYYDKI